MTADEFTKVFLSGLLYARSTDARSTFGMGEITEQYGWIIPEPWRDTLLEKLDQVPELRVERREDFDTIIIHISAFPENLDFGNYSFDDFLEIHRFNPVVYDEAVYRQRRNWRLELIPASDRTVTLNHNSTAYSEIATGLSDVREAVRQANDLDISVAESSRILHSLSAAEELWRASELKIIQIRVGVLMAVQDAAEALQHTAKAVFAGLLVDAIKAFVKSLTDIDMDRL